MMTKDICNKYCIGCGLCHSELDVEMKSNSKGYLEPSFSKDTQVESFLEKVCPVEGKKMTKTSSDIWGASRAVYEGFSTDKDIRKKASSGGVLTSLAIYLLESGKVDGVIQVSVDKESPTETKCRVSTSREQVLACCGSRYSISSPWLNLSECVEQGKKYAAIGKPCDIAALRFLKENMKQYENICYLLSFFCAGLPSKDANTRLLKELGCKEKECKSLTYRGNGWPGFATATDEDGKEYKMEYSKAWGGILGRDIHPYCRLCMDGVGEFADISCGDGWYITKDNQPDFTERDGRNIIFARTKNGEELLKEATDAHMISLGEWEDISQLQVIQKYQYTRKATMGAKILAYKLMGKVTPKYDWRVLKVYSKKIGIKEKVRVFLGTIKRILKKAI